MLVIDDSKLNLLKMKEKLLELSADSKEDTLKEYQKLVKEIDDNYYQMIIKKIRNSNYNSLSFEEQIKFYNEIIDDYNYLNELQYGFRKIYSKYTNESLKLSDLGNIMIDSIEGKKSLIEGYLMNIKNLKSNKIEIERLNQALIDATKEQNRIQELITNIRSRLKNDVLNAKGRIYGENDSLEVTSIAVELKKHDIDLSSLVDDEALIDELFGEAKKNMEDTKETLNLALSIPNKDEAICKQYTTELLEANYKFNLMELIKEIYDNENDYNLFKDSLYKIADLIKEIKNCLRELQIRFYINPFDHIKIAEYIKEFERVKDRSEEITETRKTIDYFVQMIEEMEKANNEFLLSVGDETTILREDINTIYVSFDEEPEPKKKVDTILFSKEGSKDNQIIRITSIGKKFMLDRVREKTSGVIKRVNAMVNANAVKETVPELVMEKSEEPTAIIQDDLFKEETPFDDPIFFDERQDGDILEPVENKMIIDMSNTKPKTIFLDEEPAETVPEPVPEKPAPEAFWTLKDTDEMVDKLVEQPLRR